MKALLRGDVAAIPAADPRTLRIRLRRGEFPDETAIVEGQALGAPDTVRVLLDQTVPIADAARLSAALKEITAGIDRHVEAFVVNGGRLNP